MAAARTAAVVLADEFLFLLMNSSKGRKNHIRNDSYFERIVPPYSLSDFRSHFRMSRTAVIFLEGLLAACPDLPYEQKKSPFCDECE